MAPVHAANEADFELHVGEFDAQTLKVVAFEGYEGVSELFRFNVELCSDQPDLDLDGLVGKRAALQISGSAGSRNVHGIVRGFERTGHGSSLTYYAAEIVPIHWLLTKRHQSRVFEPARCSDMSVPGIIRKVLTDAGLDERTYRFALQCDYEKREFVVQYRESDMDFIARLMEEEGIFYFFEHSDETHCLVIGDGVAALAENPLGVDFPFRDPNGLVSEREFVFDVRDRREIQHGAVNLDDFNFKQPGVDLQATTHAGRDTALEFSDFPGEYVDKDTGARYARIRLEEYQCARHVTHLRATVRSLLPGYRFRLIEHPVEELNREYLVTQIVHRARQPQSGEEEAESAAHGHYECELGTIPAEVPFRPSRTTLRPVVRGSQTALVVGPPDEEIYTDDYGRVKMQFHWDREGGYNENSSCWVRVSQGWAGGNYGMMFLPRVGQEVIVDFLEGDPDRPIITGRVYNNDHMPPYKLPEEKTKSTIKTRSSKGGDGTNEIRFEDAKGSEQVLLHAQRDLHIRVKNDRVENIEHDCHLTVNYDRLTRVKGDQNLTVEGNLKQKIQADVSTAIGGKESMEVEGTRSLTCRSDVVEDFQTNHRHEVAQTYTTHATSIQLEATSEIELRCGASSIVLSAAGIFIEGRPFVNINSGAGPGVPPVFASATTPEAPALPIDADTVRHGSDTRYDGVPPEQAPADPAPKQAVDEHEDDALKTSWIEIQLMDEADQPIPGERYELRLPNGKLRRGTLDANGLARITGIQPGTCQICFPNLDANAWERV